MEALYIKGGGWSVAFSFGIIQYLLEQHENKLRNAKWAGWSAGSLTALHILSILHDTDNRTPLQRHIAAMEFWFKNTIHESSRRSVMNNWGDCWLEYFIHLGFIRNPELYTYANDKVHIGLTKLRPGTIIPKPMGEVISKYKSNAHMMEVSYHSCYCPGFMQKPAIALKRWQGDKFHRLDGVYFENKIMLSDQYKRDEILVIGRRGDGQCDISPDPMIFGHRPVVSVFDITPRPRYLYEMYDNGYHQAKKYDETYKIK